MVFWTGTLTTAHIEVFHDRITTFADTTADEVLLYAALASNANNKVGRTMSLLLTDADLRLVDMCCVVDREPKDDPIDKAIFESLEKRFGGDKAAKGMLERYRPQAFFPFDAAIKRTVARVLDKETGRTLTISKGLVDKVLSTGEDGAEGGTWDCKDLDQIRGPVRETDAKMGKRGYKTLGLVSECRPIKTTGQPKSETREEVMILNPLFSSLQAVSIDNGPVVFYGIIPMLDPPRHDTAETLRKLQELGITIKMITGR